MLSQYQTSPKRTTLPSIHSLSLDLPSFNYQRQMPVPVTQYGYQPYISTVPVASTSYSESRIFSPISSPEQVQQQKQQREQYYQYQAQENVAMPSPPVKEALASPISNKRTFESISPEPEQESQDDSDEDKKNSKPRKKRQCPECKLYFSNLATHKSTHLKPTSRPHICKYCSRGFARPNDLFRHVKCHWKEIGSDKGQFKCPFKKLDDQDTETDHCCHNTGIFSRCDTFKNHLKAIHFQYPNGTKKDQRMKVAGKCRMCQVEFKNVDDWLVNHVEKNGCSFALNVVKKEV